MTPGGLGAVTVYAVPRGVAVASAFELRSSRGRPRRWPEPGRFVAGRLVHRGELLDEIVVVGGDAKVEWHLHGGEGVARRVEAALRSEGCPGASSTVTGTTGVLPPPTTWRQARARLSAERGPLSRLDVALAEGPVIDADLRRQLGRARARLRLGVRLARPAVVRIIGRPNAGKSTLFNALLGHERALVSPTAGTTRDPVVAGWSLRGVAVQLEDTAGEAGRPGASAAAGADLLVHLLSEPEEATVPAESLGGAALLPVLGRSDVRPAVSGRSMVSGRSGEGLAPLIDAIAVALDIPHPGADDLFAAVDPGLAERLERAAAGRAGRHSSARIP